MPDQSWAEGYIVDIDYTQGYYRDLAPALLRFVTLLGGVRVPDTEGGFTYYELACGQGFSTALHAAANPQGRFIGADFNPSHIQNAQRLARDAGIGNLQFLEKSFGELLEMDLPDAEIIGLHGIWTWVGDEQRRQIVEFIRRRLRPGGVVYVSYNCLPGLAQVAPLQRLLVEHAGTRGGNRIEQMRRAIDFAVRLEKAGAQFFAASPIAKARLARFGGENPRYLVHEYFNDNWPLFFHADVARDLAAAKLSYVGSTAIVDNFDQFVLRPEIAKLVAEVQDRTFTETIKDFTRNQVFRKDVFARGAPKLGAPELDAMLGRTRFALARARSLCSLKGPTPAGEVTLSSEAYAPVLDALARAPMSFDELARAPETAKLDRSHLRQAVFGMAALGNVLPALPAEGEQARRAATSRLNRLQLAGPASSGLDTALASPVLGSGVLVGVLDRIFIESARPEAEAIEFAREAISRMNLKLAREGKLLETDAEIRASIAEKARVFFGDTLPHYRQLGVLD